MNVSPLQGSALQSSPTDNTLAQKELEDAFCLLESNIVYKKTYEKDWLQCNQLAKTVRENYDKLGKFGNNVENLLSQVRGLNHLRLGELLEQKDVEENPVYESFDDEKRYNEELATRYHSTSFDGLGVVYFIVQIRQILAELRQDPSKSDEDIATYEEMLNELTEHQKKCKSTSTMNGLEVRVQRTENYLEKLENYVEFLALERQGQTGPSEYDKLVPLDEKNIEIGNHEFHAKFLSPVKQAIDEFRKANGNDEMVVKYKAISLPFANLTSEIKRLAQEGCE